MTSRRTALFPQKRKSACMRITTSPCRTPCCMQRTRMCCIPPHSIGYDTWLEHEIIGGQKDWIGRSYTFMKNNTANNYTKSLINFLGINIIIFLVGLFMGILALYLSFGILAKLAIVLMGASAIIDSKGNIRFWLASWKQASKCALRYSCCG